MSKPQPNFHGQRAFISKPETIAFKDFRKSTLSRHHFDERLHQLQFIQRPPSPRKYQSKSLLNQNYFEVEFHPKGKMAPGTTCDIRFKFIPQINEDIHS